MENTSTNIAYIAVLEILFLNKIHKIRQDVWQQDSSAMQQVATEFSLQPEEHLEDDYILFRGTDNRIGSLLQLLHLSLRIKELLGHSSSIFEFNILVFQSPMDSSSIAKKLRTQLLKLPGDNKIWLFQEVDPVVRYSMQISVVDKGLQEVLAANSQCDKQNFLQKCRQDILACPQLAQQLQQAIASPLVQTIGVVGSSNSGKTAFLQDLCGPPAQFIYLSAHSACQDPSYPFVSLLLHLQQHLQQQFSPSAQRRLEHLVQRVQLTGKLSLRQIEVDIYELVCDLLAAPCSLKAGENSVVLICDHLDHWPTEAIAQLQALFFRLRSGPAPFTIICGLRGIYYPLPLHELLHFPQQRAAGQQQPLFRAKERLWAILLSQRSNAHQPGSFYSLLLKGLQEQESLVLAAVQKYPYVLNRTILAQVLQDHAALETVDHLLDYYFLIEMEDHYGKHLFPSLGCEHYPVRLSLPRAVEEAIATYFCSHAGISSTDIFSLHILLQNGIPLFEALESELFQLLELGFVTVVRHFIAQHDFENYDLAITLWDAIYQKNRAELRKMRPQFDQYKIGKDNIHLLRVLSNYYYSILDLEKSLAINKEAMYLFNQNSKYKPYIQEILYIQSKIFIAKCMFKEAIEYINIGLESLRNEACTDKKYQFIQLKMLSLFLQRDFHSAMQVIEKYQSDQYSHLYGKVESYFELNLLIARIYFEIGQYAAVRKVLERLQELAEYYHLDNFLRSIYCWIARVLFYSGNYQQGFELLRGVEECEEKLYFLSEGYYFYDNPEDALRCATSALRESIKKADERNHNGLADCDNVYSLQEGHLHVCRGKRDPLLLNILGFSAYLQILHGNCDIADKILGQICHRPSSEYRPFQHIFYYFYYLLLQKKGREEGREDMLYLSYAISILQNDASRILNTKTRHHYIYNNYWNNLLAAEGELHNLLVLGGPRNYNSS